jgi:hypothetical protein
MLILLAFADIAQAGWNRDIHPRFYKPHAANQTFLCRAPDCNRKVTNRAEGVT